MKTIISITLLTIILNSCATTERARVHTYKPKPVSGQYLVNEIRGNLAYCSGLPRPVFVSDTVQVGEYIALDIHFKQKSK